MAESTSVGKIQLDIEINPQSLNSEMAKLNKMFSGSFKNMFSGMAKQSNNLVKESINRIGNSFKNFVQAGTGSNEKISKSVSKLNNQYEKTQEEIRKIQEELTTLDMKRDAIFAKYKNFPAFSGMSKDESLEHMLQSDTEFQKLSTEIDKLTTKMDPLKEKSRSLAEEIKNAGNESNKTGNNFKKMGNSAKKAGKSIFNLSWLKRMFTNESKKASNATSNFGKTMNRVSRMIARNLIVYGLIIKGLKSMISYMWSALKTNRQFAQSLNIIRTNLLVAFQPIYNFIIPALNALMQAIARVTQYIATAISALFGKTYQQSFNAAKSMNSAIKGMDGYGKAAKKAGKEAKGALMGFDEINQLDIKNDTDDTGGGGGAGGFEMEMPDLATIDIGGIERFKEIMRQIFEPFKKAWKNEGQATIDAMKYALKEIKELIKAIGRSWLEAWTNGTGQAILETMLRILQNIFNSVGDIAKATRLAWEENDLGTKVLQSLADMILNILKLIESIGNAWREVWNNGTGQETVTIILEIFKEIFDLIGNIADSLRLAWEENDTGIKIIQNLADAFNIVLGIIRDIGKSLNDVWGEVGQAIVKTFMGVLESATGVLKKVAEGFRTVWDYGGQHLLESLIKLGAKVLEIAGVIFTDFVAPFVMWFVDMIAPAIGIALDWIGYLVDGIIWLLDGFLQFLGGVKKFVEGVVNFFKWLYDVLVGNSIVPDMINDIISWFENLFEWAIEIVSNLVESIVEFFTNLWEIITEITTGAWNSLKEFLSGVWNGIKSIAETTWNGIKKVILDPINQAWTSLKEIWDKIKKYILDKWNEIKQGISSMKNALVNAVMEPFKIVDGKIKGIIGNARDWGRNLIGNFIDGIKAMINKVKEAATNVANAVKDRLGFSSPTKEGPGSDADKWMPNMMEMFAAGIEDNIAQVSSAINMTAGAIQQGVQPNTDDVASAVGSAVLQSMQMAGNNQGQESGDIILQIDGITVGRILGPIIDREKERIGEPVVKSI